MSIAFRPLTRADFSSLQKWLAEPHVKIWWNDDFNLDQLEAKYGPRIDGHEPTHVFIILINQNPIGIIQYYKWSHYPDHAKQLGANQNSAGIDLAIGERDKIGKGLGPQVIREFIEKIVVPSTQVTSVIADPEIANIGSLRAFEKAGFNLLGKVQLQGENHIRQVVIFRTTSTHHGHIKLPGIL